LELTIKKVRSKFGLTQKQMAKVMGMAQPTLARIESGKRAETKGHIAHIHAIDLLYENCLMDTLINSLQAR